MFARENAGELPSEEIKIKGGIKVLLEFSQYYLFVTAGELNDQ